MADSSRSAFADFCLRPQVLEPSSLLLETLAFCARELAEERDAESPNQEKIETLEKQVLELKRDKMFIGVDNSEVINKALYFYAPLLKEENRSNWTAAFSWNPLNTNASTLISFFVRRRRSDIGLSLSIQFQKRLRRRPDVQMRASDLDNQES